MDSRSNGESKGESKVPVVSGKVLGPQEMLGKGRQKAGKPPALVCSVYRSRELEDILKVGKIAFYFVYLSSDLLPFLLCAKMSNSKAVDGK